MAGGARSVTQDILGLWNTNGLSGLHTLRLTATDKAGNTREQLVPITIAERTTLVSYLDAAPRLFSPNGDDNRDTTAIRIGVEEQVNLSLLVKNVSDNLVRTLTSAQTVSPGAVTYAWDGKDDQGALLPDGDYTIALVATLTSNPGFIQEEAITVSLDATLPVITITRPEAGFVTGVGNIVGSIQDLHLTDFTVSVTNSPNSPVWQVLATGTDNQTTALLGDIEGLVEGAYALQVIANDEAGNTNEQIIAFEVDNTPPKVTIQAPADNAVLGINKMPIDVVALIEEKNIRAFTLNIGAGNTPSTLTELITGNSLPLSNPLTILDVSGLADGVHTLQLLAEDKADNTTEARITLIIDNTPPTVSITTPANDDYIKEPLEILGTVTDPNLQEYRLFIAPGDVTTANQWSEIGTGNAQVSDARLLDWQALPPDGVHTLKLEAIDHAANEAQVLVAVNIDTHPPAAPINLEGAVQGSDVSLTWDANPEPDVIGYAVYRAGQRITPTLITSPQYIDANVPEGQFEYRVTAFDRADWESEQSAPINIAVDTTPPSVTLSVPGDGTLVTGLLDIIGTAHSADDFKEYRLFAGLASNPDNLGLLRKSPVPILGDILSQWNTTVLVEGASYRLRLEGEDINGNVGIDEVTVTVDNLPPAAPTGLVAVPNGADVNLTWNPNSETDLLGYLVFRNDRLANVDTVVVGELKPFAIVITAFSDLTLADGPYTYNIVAIDQAGNLSDPSTPSQVLIDTRAPHAVIDKPEDNSSFETPLYILAASEDTDIAQVQFQFKAVADATWTNLGAADTTLPYEANLDPTVLGLVFGDFQIQAIATDTGNKIDPAPTPITVTYTDLTRPAAASGLSALVNGGDVTLTWTANTESDIAGYHVDRIDEQGNTVRLTTTVVTTTNYVDAGLADRIYAYAVIAVDTSNNAADPSNQVSAQVYTPTLIQPFTPTLVPTITLQGNGVVQATVNGEVITATGMQVLTPVATDAQGAFVLTSLALESGTNAFTLRLTDGAGNVSKPASVIVTLGVAPSQPTGLTASAVNLDVTLNWNANPETDIFGYRVFRNGEAVLPDVPITGLIASASFNNAIAFRAVDTSSTSFWDTFLDNQWLAVALPSPQLISQVSLAWQGNFYAPDFDIEAWSGASWITVAQVRDNAQSTNDVVLASPYVTDQIRLVVLRLNLPNFGRARVLNLAVFAQGLTTTPSLVDVVADGNHTYTVTAVNNLGFESIPSDPATVPVGDVVAPDPVTLSVTVSGSDALLSWTASPSTDVVRYDIYRDNILITSHTDLINLTHTDAGLVNGTYSYVVRAVDGAGNASVPSNTLQATINIALPAVPVALTVTVVPTGGALDLIWQPGTGSAPSSYQVLRATVTGGPYTVVDNVVTTILRDTGLTNGVTYFYVIVALDALGNISANSSEVSGIPNDSVAPEVTLHYPTVSGQLFITGQPFIEIAGFSEPGATLNLFQDGNATLSTQAQTGSTFDRFLRGRADQIMPLSPDGRFAAIFSFDQEIKLYDFNLGQEKILTTINCCTNPNLSWSRDGERLIYIDFDPNTGNRYVRAYELSDDTITNLTDPTAGRIDTAVMSPDGTQLAAIGINAQDNRRGLWRIDLDSGTWILLVEDSIFSFNHQSLQWSPDGINITYLRTSPSLAIEIVNSTTGTVQVIETQAGNSKPQWSPDGSALLYTSRRNGNEQVWRYLFADGSNARLTLDTRSYRDPVWTADGSEFLYIVNSTDLESRDLATGQSTLILSSLFFFSRTLQQTTAGYYGVFDSETDELVRFALAGRFQFGPSVLTVGDNVFSATATDTAGNVSAPSDAIIVNYNVNDRPDLVINENDLRILPAAPLTGETTRVSLTVQNNGTKDSSSTGVSLLAIDPLGNSTTLIDGNVLNAIPAGGAQTVAADWTLPDEIGTYNLVASVDPFNNVVEVSEANNFALRQLVVASDALPQLTITTDKATYFANEDVLAQIQVSNSGDTFSGQLVIVIEDSAGFPVQPIHSQAITDLVYGDSLNVNATWNTGNTFAGVFQVHARLLDNNGQQVNEANVPFNLAASVPGLSSTIATDRASYDSNANARVTSIVSYTDGNSILSNAVATLRILDSANQVLAEKITTLGDLLPGYTSNLSLDWNTGIQADGLYSATVDVVQVTEVISTSQTNFTIQAGTINLNGILILSAPAPAAGEPQVVTYTVRNLGNGALSQLPITISLIDPDLFVSLDTKQANVDISVGGDVTNSVIFITTGLSLKTYSISLQAQITESDGTTRTATLDTASFVMTDRTPPVVEFREPQDQSFIRGSAIATVRAVDTLSGIDNVQISVDGGAFNAAPIFNQVENLYGLGLPNLAEGLHTLVARATDAANNTANSAVISFTVDNTPPVISITGVVDGGLFNTTVTPVITITDANLDQSFITLNGASFVSGTPLNVDDSYTLVVHATDLAGNISQQELSFDIDTTPPVITITGVEDGGLFNTPVTPVITITDDHLNTQTITLNGQPFVSGTPVTADSLYQLEVFADDALGQQTSVSLSFEIDTVPPTVTVTSPSEGQTINTLTTDVTGQTEALATVFLNIPGLDISVLADATGQFTFNQVPLVEGENILSLFATDRATNTGPTLTLTVNVVITELNGEISPTRSVLVWSPLSKRCRDDDRDDDDDKDDGHKHKGKYKDDDGHESKGKDKDDEDDDDDHKVQCHSHTPGEHLGHDNDPLLNLVGNTLNRDALDYLVVHSESDFIQALRSQRYGTLVLTELHQGNDDDDKRDDHGDHDDHHGGDNDGHDKHGGDHGDDDSHHLDISDSALLEIRAMVASGTGLVLIKTHPDNDEHWQDVIGAKVQGVVSKLVELQLPDSPASQAGTWAIAGTGLKVKLEGGQGVGSLVSKHKTTPALVLNAFGQGKTVLVAFNPADLTDTVAAQDIVSNLIKFAAPTQAATHSGGVIETRWTANNVRPPLDAQFDEKLADDMRFVFTQDGVVDPSGQEATWLRNITTDSDVFTALVQLPIAKEDYTITGELLRVDQGFAFPIVDEELIVTVDADQSDREVALMTTLTSLSLSNKDTSRLNKAIDKVQAAIVQTKDTQTSVAEAIDDLLRALKQLQKLKHAQPQAETQLGELLRIYQVKWEQLGSSG